MNQYMILIYDIWFKADIFEVFSGLLLCNDIKDLHNPWIITHSVKEFCLDYAILQKHTAWKI